ncbi:uncharacterized protein LOC130702764 [Daphnia carinata]|uniref:uncharacterized protein LOC130702764 n=1 Tax=Daphnia carinata TaxID=120202 RepID=UPI00257CFAE8|nr:uncharacterized protein LOC130702764 [Daphnia carinata]
MARLSVLILVLFITIRCKAEGLFEDGHEYQYSYQAYTMTGVREPTLFSSSFGIRGNLIIQKQPGIATLKLSDLTLGMHNGPETLFNTIKFLKKPDLASLEKPFKLTFLNGKITGFYTDSWDAEWSVNFKKALATNLQMDFYIGDIGKEETAYMRVVEDTISGTCNTSYSFSDDGKGRFLLFKQRTQRECTNIPSMGFNTVETTTCAGTPQNDLLATTQSYYKLSRGTASNTVKAESISSLGHQALQLYPPTGTPFYNRANTTLLLKSLSPLTKPIAAPGLTKHYATLRYTFRNLMPTADGIDLTREEDYFHPEEPQSQLLLRSKAVPMLTKLKSVIGWSPLNEEALTDSSTSDCIQLMSAMSLESLVAVWKSIEKDDELKNLYVEILPLTGTNPAALMIKGLILGGKISDIEAQRTVALIPYYLRMPSEKLLANWEDLLKSSSSIKTKELRGAITLAFSHLIGVTCSGNTQRPCKPDTINKYARILYDAFKAAKTHQEMMVSLIALRNSKLIPAIERLVPHTKSGSVSRTVRPHVIISIQLMAASNREKFLSAIMPIIHNTTETTEIRVAAISTLFRAKPNLVELQELVGIIEDETNKEVLNFILTTFRSYTGSKNSCLKRNSGDLELLIRRVDHLKTDFFLSNNRAFDFHDEKHGFGGGLQLVTVYGEESRAPLIISAKVNYRLSEHRYVPLEVMIRLEGVDEAYVRYFRKVDPKDFKLDVLKDLLQKTLKIAPRQKAPFKMEVILRSQGYDWLYHHMGGEELASLMEGKALKDLISRGFKLTRSMVMLGGQKMTWIANDIGIPVAVGMSNPGFGRHQLSYGDQSQLNKIGRTIQAGLDVNLQMITYMVAYNPLNGTQGIVKSRGSRIHLPMNAQFVYSIPDSQIEIKMNTATEEKPLSFLFTSKTNAVLSGKDDAKAVSYLKDTCPQCESNSLVTRGSSFRKGIVVRENINPLLGLESHLEVYDCEAYTGKASVAKVLYGSFKPSEINSHGSLPGFLTMGLMQMRNYFYLYPPVGSCSMKAVVHRTRENPAEAIEIKLKKDNSPPPWKRAPPGVTYSNVKGSITLLGNPQRKWNVELNIEKEPFNIKSLVAVKIARLANPTLGVPSRALCVNVRTAWAVPPQDLFETPSTVQPSVQRDVTFVWGEAPVNECPKANAKGISTITIKVIGNITDAQQEAAIARNTYPYDRCDLDRYDAGRSGAAGPMSQACYDAVLVYATPRNYKLDIKYENMSPRGQTALDRISTLLRPVLLPYLITHNSLSPAKNVAGSGQIELKMDVGEDDVDLLVRTDQSLSQYENVDYLKNAGMLLRNARFQMWHLTAMKAGWVGVCDVAPQEVVTFDKVKTNYELTSCYTLISADCSPTPRYAIFAKKSNVSLPMAVKIYVGGHTLEFTPILKSIIANNGFEIKADDKLVNIEANKPYVLSDKDNITQYAVVNFISTRYFIQIPILKLTLRYTGDDITTMIAATHRAQHCGLCGDYNGQTSQEFVGPSGCILGNGTDLARSYVLRDKVCKEGIQVPNCVDPGSQKKSSGFFGFFDRLIRP